MSAPLIAAHNVSVDRGRRPAGAWMTGLALLVAVGAASLRLPQAVAAQGETPAQAVPIGSDGRFSGAVAPQSAQWYRFAYRGGTSISIVVAYVPTAATGVDIELYTGDASNPRSENVQVLRRDNTLTANWSDPSARDVFLQVVNTGPSSTVGFVGTIYPGSALSLPAATAPPTSTPGVENGSSATAALTLGTDGAFAGTLAARQAVWYRFWYANPGANASVSVAFTPKGTNSDLNLYTGADPGSLSAQGGSPVRITPTSTPTPTATPSVAATTTPGTPVTATPTPSDLGSETLTRTINLSSAQWVYLTVVNNNDGTSLAYAGSAAPVGAPPVTPTVTPTATPTSTATPTTTPTPVALVPPSVPHDSRYFSQTGFRIDNDSIWGYFQARGGVDVFGYPVSRTFAFLGCTTQIMQRKIAQVCSDGQPRLINVLDPEIFPYTRVNGSTFPPPDDGLKASTPKVDDPNYGTAILDFVRANAPDTFAARPVLFGRTFFDSVTAAQAGTSDPNILGLLALEVWGAPISAPAFDPNNPNFVYQRFQRGILHYDASTGVTRGILLADYLKSVLMARNLPDDLRQQAQGSRFYAQYAPGVALWTARPGDLPGSDLTWAFEPG